MDAYTVGMCKRLGLALIASAIAATLAIAFPRIGWVFLIAQAIALFLISMFVG